MRIASYNVENLFERAIAMSADAPPGADAAILTHGKLNTILRKATYSASDRTRILKLLEELGLLKDDDGGPFALLRQNRGQLVVRRQNGNVELVAKGRGDWVGWVELKTEPVSEVATENTARVIDEVGADVIGVVEAESRHSLRDFSRTLLREVGGQPYEHTMLIDGNDDRGINVALMTKEGFEFEAEHTHVFDLVPGEDETVFSRDCPEYLVRLPGGGEILVLVNHFKSKRGGGDARRLLQATRVKEIVLERLPEQPNIVVLGDLNDTPDSSTLAPLLTQTPLKDVSTHPDFDDGGFPGTFGTQGARNKIDYLLLSPALMDRVTAGGIFRKGVFSASDRWPMFDQVTSDGNQASDHAAIFADIDVT